MGSQTQDGNRSFPSPPAVGGGTRIYAVGDIHGRADLLAAMHGLIEADSHKGPPGRRMVVYLGDYVDRGPDSAAVVDLLIHHPLARFERVHLKGNHEDLLLAFMEGRARSADWMLMGGDETLRSYGIHWQLDFPGDGDNRLRARLGLGVPKGHWDFFHALGTLHVEGSYLFVHAGIVPGVPLDGQPEDDLLWIRHEFLDSETRHPWRVVHGHSIAPEPEMRANRIGIDTGAFMSGRLTAAVLEGDAVRFLQT
jgi:serine/threonine protein phosphatase 1